jgi:hypothetical protein
MNYKLLLEVNCLSVFVILISNFIYQYTVEIYENQKILNFYIVWPESPSLSFPRWGVLSGWFVSYARNL